MQCRYCLRDRKITDFGVALTTETKVYRRRKCRDCYRETKKKLQDNYTERVRTYKKERGCNRCSFSDPRALDFHHPNNDKEFNIANQIRRSGWERLLAEIEKCEILCANCHRIEHSNWDVV